MIRSGLRAPMVVVALAACATVAGCGKKEFKYDTNLLVNGSFEQVGKDGIPQGWVLLPFRGAENESEVVGLLDDGMAQEGSRSWSFRADPGTRRFYLLAQEVGVPEDATHVRLSGWMQLEDVMMRVGQFAQCNFLLTFYDVNHTRFSEMRVADKRTPLRNGAQLWTQEDHTFRLPKGTRYVQVSCVLGMNGRVWFDNVTLSVPKPIRWEEQETKNFVFHWLPGHPMPEGSIPSQQAIFDNVAARLGVTSDVVIQYYFYPDTSTIRSILSLKGYEYVSWDDYEFHSINPNDNHELVHFITDPVGRPPRSISEGTVFWINDDWNGVPLDEAVGRVVKAGALPSIGQLVEYSKMASLDPDAAFPAAASFVSFIVERWGTAKFIGLYAAANGVNSYSDFATAFESVYKVPLAEVEAAWRTYLRAKYGRS